MNVAQALLTQEQILERGGWFPQIIHRFLGTPTINAALGKSGRKVWDLSAVTAAEASQHWQDAVAEHETQRLARADRKISGTRVIQCPAFVVGDSLSVVDSVLRRSSKYRRALADIENSARARWQDVLREVPAYREADDAVNALYDIDRDARDDAWEASVKQATNHRDAVKKYALTAARAQYKTVLREYAEYRRVDDALAEAKVRRAEIECLDEATRDQEAVDRLDAEIGRLKKAVWMTRDQEALDRLEVLRNVVRLQELSDEQSDRETTAVRGAYKQGSADYIPNRTRDREFACHAKACQASKRFKRLRVDRLSGEGSLWFDTYVAGRKGNPTVAVSFEEFMRGGCGVAKVHQDSGWTLVSPRRRLEHGFADSQKNSKPVSGEWTDYHRSGSPYWLRAPRAGGKLRRVTFYLDAGTEFDAYVKIRREDELAPGTRLTSIQLKASFDGSRRRFEALLTVDGGQDVHRANQVEGDNPCGHDLGWRDVGTGFLVDTVTFRHPVTVAGHHSLHHRLVIPYKVTDLVIGRYVRDTSSKPRWTPGRADQIRSTSDHLFTTALEQVLALGRTSTGMRALLDGMANDRARRFGTAIKPVLHAKTRSHAKLARVFTYWCAHRFAGDEEHYAALEAWFRKDKHLQDFEDGLRRRFRDRRDAICREFAAAVSHVATANKVENLKISEARADWRERQEILYALGQAPSMQTLADQRGALAPATFQNLLIKESQKAGIPIGQVEKRGTSKACIVQGCTGSYDDSPRVMLTCTHGHREDRDIAGSTNVSLRDVIEWYGRDKKAVSISPNRKRNEQKRQKKAQEDCVRRVLDAVKAA